MRLICCACLFFVHTRWDEEGEERRPSRVVQHYATCSLRKKDGDFFSLGKLARAIRTVKPKPKSQVQSH